MLVTVTRILPPLLTAILIAGVALIPPASQVAAESVSEGQAAAKAPQPRPAPDAAAVDRGRITYGFYCMNCHGGDGRGGVDGGSDLRESQMLQADDAGSEFAAFLPVGRPEQRMPATPLGDDDIADLWAFLQVLIAPEHSRQPGRDGEALEGNAEAGARHFKTAGCTSCHSITGDLEGIGGRLDVSTIRQRLLEPSAITPATTSSAQRAAADRLRRHTDSVKKLAEQDVRDVAVYLATLR
jgi:mono/diheme cytochrome c family protein